MNSAQQLPVKFRTIINNLTVRRSLICEVLLTIVINQSNVHNITSTHIHMHACTHPQPHISHTTTNLHTPTHTHTPTATHPWPAHNQASNYIEIHTNRSMYADEFHFVKQLIKVPLLPTIPPPTPTPNDHNRSKRISRGFVWFFLASKNLYLSEESPAHANAYCTIWKPILVWRLSHACPEQMYIAYSENLYLSQESPAHAHSKCALHNLKTYICLKNPLPMLRANAYCIICIKSPLHNLPSFLFHFFSLSLSLSLPFLLPLW